MLRFSRSGRYWWRKPLVLVDNRALPAELAVLATVLRSKEKGVWLNSRSKASGVVDLVPWTSSKGPTFRTVRATLPVFVAAGLERVYDRAKLARGCPDLVIWRTDREAFRLVEVKCPHWDRPSAEQHRFIAEARRAGIDTRVVEWEFDDAA